LGKWPALDVFGGDELALAAADEFLPTAAETRGETLRLFFANPIARDAAAGSLSDRYSVAPLEVDDEDWARRSQEHLSPIAIGRVLVLPDPLVSGSSVAQAFRPANAGLKPRATIPNPPLISVIIRPSMGFGTGHHPTTRLCLLALQSADLRGAFLLDVGTGSGILAIAAARLGAARVLGLDNDADAIQSANENLALNPGAGNVGFQVADLLTIVLPTADLIVANLTGTLLARTAGALVGALSPGGLLIVGGILADEEEMVDRAFTDVAVTQRRQEDEWRCLVMMKAEAAGPGAK
jgi:ribosomal protein L11 methyltransferase